MRPNNYVKTMKLVVVALLPKLHTPYSLKADSKY